MFAVTVIPGIGTSLTRAQWFKQPESAWSYCWANLWSSAASKLTTMSWSSQFDSLTCYVIGYFTMKYPISQRNLQRGAVNNVKSTVTEWSRQY